MTALADGIISSHMEGPENLSLRKWKQLSIRITVIQRFSRNYSVRSFIAPGLTAVSPQGISKVKKSNTLEGSETRNLSTELLNSGALFSPNTPILDAPKQKFKSEKKNGEGYSFKPGDVFKDHRVLSPIQILVTGLTSQIKEADLLGSRIIVTVIGLASRQEGTTATDNHVVWTALKGLFFLLWLSNFENCGVNAQGDSEDGKREYPNDPVDLPYIVQAAACTILAGIYIFAIITRRINRCPLAAAPPAVRLPADAPLALPAAVAAPPAARPPGNAPLAVPAAADAPPAVRPPADAPPAVPVPAAPAPAAPAPAAPAPAAPAPAGPSGDAPLALPPDIDAPPAVRPPADAPPAVPVPAVPAPAAPAPAPAVPAPAVPAPAVPAPAVPAPAVPAPAVPAPAVPAPAVPAPAVPAPAVPMVFFDVIYGLGDPTPATKSDPDFHIRRPL